MNEQQLRERMADLVATQPPPREDSATALRRGHRRLVLRGAAHAGTVVLALSGVVAAAGLLTQAGTDRSEPAIATPSADEILSRCAQTDGGSLDPDLFGPASSVLTSATGPTGDINAVIISPDGEYWAACWLNETPAPDGVAGSVATYRWETRSQREGEMETNTMGWGTGEFRYVDRFPTDVARVELDFPRGPTLAADTVDGFVAFAASDEGTDDHPVITLYDADGMVLADSSMAPGDTSLPEQYQTLVPNHPMGELVVDDADDQVWKACPVGEPRCESSPRVSWDA